MPKTEAPEQILGCVGYYGFGGGWVAGQQELKGQKATGESYCVRCPLATECWNRHESRVRQMFPGAVKALDHLAGMTGLHGIVLHQEFERRWGQTSPSLAVMRGNIEDGVLVGAGDFPVERGTYTLPYPFKQRN